MIPEVGQFALILALLLAVTQATLPLIGAARGNRAWVAVAVPAGQAQFIFVAIAICCLGYSFITNDFSVLNVATNSNSRLPLHYRLAATWGSHEGSLLLWTFMLGLWTVAVSLFSRHLPEDMVARVLSVMGIVSVVSCCHDVTERFASVSGTGQAATSSATQDRQGAHPRCFTWARRFSVAFASRCRI